ncbi:MAG TPA: META domain-containing protein [Candidatus Limnocylindrales bacterium]
MRARSILALIAVAALVSAACVGGDGSGGELAGTDWVLRSYEKDGALTLVPDTLYADAEFDNYRLHGFAGCNEFDALYHAGGRRLTIAQPAATQTACSEEAMNLEQAYLAQLNGSRFYTARLATLTVFGEGSTTLVFDAAPRNPVRGTWQVESFASAPGKVAAPREGSDLDVVFGIASVGGFGGCNSFSGTYGTNGNIIRIGRLATTSNTCPEELAKQETSFLEALQGAAFVDTRASGVNLTDSSGSMNVALVPPPTEPSPSSSPAPSASRTTEPSPSPTVKATPTETATTAPTAKPTAKPTAQPTAGQSPAPSAPLVSTADCELKTADGASVATLVYPGSWSTVAAPPELACRYFDPASITVPSDPSTLETAVRASIEETAFADALAAATDPASWTVSDKADLTVDSLQAARVEATSTSDKSGLPPGTRRLAYLVDVGLAGTVTLWTAGSASDEAYAANKGVVTLMVPLSTFRAPA